jgi:uncharacterized protein YecT (DUF1311 family)
LVSLSSLARWPAVVALAALVLAACGTASSPRASSTASTLPVVTYSRACARTAVTQIALDECAGTELKELEGQLATALARQEKGQTSNVVAADRAAQAAFDTYEKAACAVAAAPNLGGTIYPLISGQCEIRLTAQRVGEIRQESLGTAGGRG